MPTSTRSDTSRRIQAPRGAGLSARSWLTEAPLRMIMNNLDPEVAERPEDLVVYGGIGRAARDWPSFDAIVETLRRLGADETLLVQYQFTERGEYLAVITAGHPASDRLYRAVFPITIGRTYTLLPLAGLALLGLAALLYRRERVR